MVCLPIVVAVIGAIVGYKIGTRKIKKVAKTKPFLNRRQIKAIFKSIGMQISEQNVNQMEKSMQKHLEDKK
jgi:uncharacterized protein YneF (UPF0154 family)